jgi:hypothetical protein
MANTYTLIASNTLSTSAASVTFSSIPATYTDLVLKFSARCDAAGSTSADLKLELNADSSSLYSDTSLTGDGTNAGSARASNQAFIGFSNGIAGNSTTANTFSSNEIYIPAYLVSQNKPLSNFNAVEHNATAARLRATAGLYRSTSVITSAKLTPEAGSSFVSGSSFFLYGIKNS